MNSNAKHPKYFGWEALLGGLIATLASSLMAMPPPVAQLDRTGVTLGESLELRLESSDSSQFSSPDLSALEGDFEVGALRPDFEHCSGRCWTVRLFPRRIGSVPIPALPINQGQTQPLLLRVEEAKTPDPTPNGPVFAEALLESTSVYVQQQAILRLKIYHALPLYADYRLSPPQTAAAEVEALGPAISYEKNLLGMRYSVIEYRYALYPQYSGLLFIPGQKFTANLAQGSTPQRLELKTPDLKLEVRGKPLGYPTDQPWLPTQRLQLEEDWSPDSPKLLIGEPFSRRLRLRAEGLSAAQLPQLLSTPASGLRRYPDQARLSHQITDDGLIGQREERELLIPLQPGLLKLPDIEVVWWNTREDRLERSRLTGRQWLVEQTSTPLTPSAYSSLGPTGSDITLNASGPHSRLWHWQLSTAVLACTSLLGFGLWWHARRQPAIPRPIVSSGPSPRTLLEELRRTCLANDPQGTRQALDAWARPQPETLANMAARFAPLAEALDRLNGALYSEAGQNWQGEALWEAINLLPPKPEEGPEQTQSTLPPLYPQ